MPAITSHPLPRTAAPSGPRPRVLFATPECAPWSKTGGLGDVSADLPHALAALGADVRVLMPAYRDVLARCGPTRAVATLPGRAALPATRLLEAILPSGVVAWLLDCPEAYDRGGSPYQDEARRDWSDNARRFALLSHAAALLARADTPLPWRPDVLHCQDWPAALAPAYLAYDGVPHAASVVTIHNLSFLGLFDAGVADEIGLAPAARGVEGAEFYGRLSFLKAGLVHADALTTVSPTYACEILSEPLGCGLSGLLAARADVLTGIRNGIDTVTWDPSTDRALQARYDADRLARKDENKAALQRWAGLRVVPDLPLFGLVSRLTEQKGVDLVVSAAQRLAALPCQIVVLGEGTPELEAAVREMDARTGDSIRAHVGFSEDLAHRITAGADGFLMPSRFEPCGLTQMFSQRYGTPPIVRATGGLRDTVVDCSPETLADGSASGFVFEDATPDALVAAVERAIAVYQRRDEWRRLQRLAMARDLGWTDSARRYGAVYASVCGVALPPSSAIARRPRRAAVARRDEAVEVATGTHG